MLTYFIGDIFDTVVTGHVFVISGKTIDGASRLDVNFRSSKQADSSIPLHISVRFIEDVIVRNTQINNEWGLEEKQDNLDKLAIVNPIIAGENFKFYIMVSENHFLIAINDQTYCTYSFRMDLSEMNAIEVCKDLQAIVQVDHRSVYPRPYPEIQDDENTINFSNDIPRSITAGHVMVLTGIPYGNIKGSFIVRFKEGFSNRLALHFNARFNPEFVVVRNAMNEDLVFGREERTGDFPFILDQQFKIAIALTEKEFKIAVNGKRFCDFGYRSSNMLSKLNGLRVAPNNGLHVEVTSIDHFNLGDKNCLGFEEYSQLT